MTTAEFSAELDTIYENINKNGAPGLDDYEKSVILTHAQELLVKETLKVDTSAFQFPQLIEIYEATTPTSTNNFSWGVVFTGINTGLIQVLNEAVIDDKNVIYTVIPLQPIKYDIIQSTPYKYPPRRRAWRISELKNGVNSVEILGRPNAVLTKYRVRYIRKPKPIIISDLHTLSPFSINVPSSYTIVNAGTGYTLGDILTVTGTENATFEVIGTSLSTVTNVAIVNKGYGITAGVNSTTSSDGIDCTLNITVTDAATIDGEYLPQTSELDKGLHRDILKIASTLAEQYYYDKYGTDGNK